MSGESRSESQKSEARGADPRAARRKLEDGRARVSQKHKFRRGFGQEQEARIQKRADSQTRSKERVEPAAKAGS